MRGRAECAARQERTWSWWWLPRPLCFGRDDPEPLPLALQAQARIARESYLAFVALVNAYSIKNLIDDGELTKFLGFGGNF
jgi:hypothetical protein